MNPLVGIIGVGNMGEALLAGLLKAGSQPSEIIFAQRSDERAAYIESKYGIARKSLEEVAAADVILLCVKPKDIADMCEAIKADLRPGAVLVSVAAGKTIAGMQAIVGNQIGIIRVMPNTPTFIGKGAAGISVAAGVSSERENFVKNFFAASGIVVEVAEELQPAITAISGSGPAYFFAFVEAMVEGGVKLGLSRDDATALAKQTIIGAAGMLAESGKSAQELRENVTSPNGTTFAALKSFENAHLQKIVEDAMKAAADRSRELA
jgi:pyrroline-5-carboxylate reductase